MVDIKTGMEDGWKYSYRNRMLVDNSVPGDMSNPG